MRGINLFYLPVHPSFVWPRLLPKLPYTVPAMVSKLSSLSLVHGVLNITMKISSSRTTLVCLCPSICGLDLQHWLMPTSCNFYTRVFGFFFRKKQHMLRADCLFRDGFQLPSPLTECQPHKSLPRRPFKCILQNTHTRKWLLQLSAHNLKDTQLAF